MKKNIQLKDGEKIFIRHIKESDIDSVWNNFNDVIDEGVYLPVFFPVKSQYEKISWYNIIKKENELCVVAVHPKLEKSHNIIGQCEISHSEWDAATHIGSLGIIVQKNYRDLGVGYNLIDFAIRESKRVNHKEKIILSCFSNNERALYLYKKLGFEIIGIRKKQFYMDSRYYDEVLMDLWIDDYLSNNS
jgi:RimJ/RimL family protein N-acetyltransferase